MQYNIQELLIATIADLIKPSNTIAIGVLSPIPGSAALLSDYQAKEKKKLYILGSDNPDFRPDHGVEIFDLAGQGRIDTFFLSGGQIDGSANINLTGIGPYPTQHTRWSGSFGSAYLYFLVPKVILFRERHTRQTLVDSVDFISSPGSSPNQVYRPGGPSHLVTNLCVFDFNKDKNHFSLKTIHPGHTLEEVLDNTAFDFEHHPKPEITKFPTPSMLTLLREEVSSKIREIYPNFAAKVWP
ncbi:MAG: CoA-transferase [Pseudomonadota bacterium]|nr:CoA-transferase [Pseudomonadota bacterium]